MFFLDADDWIVPEAFEKLLEAAASDRLDGVYGGYVRVAASGRELRERVPSGDADLFPLFARTCAIAIHACLVRTEIVRQVGGFDTSLVTCEDWDLWQRITRVGARFGTIADYISYYRMRVGSASGSAWRMLRDGLLVIDRGHTDDPRVRKLEPAERSGMSDAERNLARTYFACYTAGLEIATGASAVGMLDLLGDRISADADSHGVAETLFGAIPVGRAAGVAEWSEFPEEVHRQCRAFIDALGHRVGNHWLSFRTHAVFEGLLLRHARTPRPHVTGRWYVADVELEGSAIESLELGPGVERALLSLRLDGEPVDDVEVAIVDGWLPARALADALVADTAWDLLRAFLERNVYPELGIERARHWARVSRNGKILFEGRLDPAVPTSEALHDQIGWTLFLQELWDRPSFSSSDFYDDGSRMRFDRGAARVVEKDSVAVDIAEPLPRLHVRGRSRVTIEILIAGVPLSAVVCDATDGWVSTHQLRKAILLRSGYELLRAVLREALVLGGEGAHGSLGERLARVLATRRACAAETLGAAAYRLDGSSASEPGHVVIGRSSGADGTSASRWVVFPASAASARVALARKDQDPVHCPDATEQVQRLLCAPLPNDAEGGYTGAEISDESLLRSMPFERLFAEADPWNYASDYEQVKYRQTLALLPDHVGCALELGCAEGAFTVTLAERATRVTAADISLIALARARERCASATNVRIVRLDVFDEPLGDPYDTIVCSELLYYAEGVNGLRSALAAMAASLKPGGVLVMAHANAVVDQRGAPGFDWDVPFGAKTIERACRGTGLLELERELRTSHYRVQRYVRRSRRRRAPLRRPPKRNSVRAGRLDAQHASRFLPDGGEPSREQEHSTPVCLRMPILMYHRIAPEGRQSGGRWRLHPRDFEAQLRWLRERDYVSLTFEQWRVASDRRWPLPSRSVMLTFDDGFADFPDYALPLLSRYGFQATMFVVTDFVGTNNAWDKDLGERIPLMDWATIAELPARGVQLGSHSSRHDPLVSLSSSKLAEDFCRSRLKFYEHLGEGARAVCYPYGLYDVGVLAVARGCGFRYGVTTEEWQASLGDDQLRLPRLEVRGSDTLADFAAKLER